MQTITINVVGKVATAEGSPFIVCGNSDYTILFNFDKAWDGYNAKTARFSYEQDGEEIIAEVPFAGNSCKAPVIHNTKKVYIGAYAGDILSTTRCGITCKASILDGEGIEHKEPPEDIYNQIVGICNEAVTAAGEATAAAAGFEATTKELFANAIKGTLCGAAVRADDVSPVEHNISVKVDHADPASITLTRCGKNLLEKNKIQVAKQEHSWVNTNVEQRKVPSGNYVASCNFEQLGIDKSQVQLSIRSYDDYMVVLNSAASIQTTGKLVVPFTVKEEHKGFQVYVYSNSTADILTTDCIFNNIMVEKGEIATEFEAYKGTPYTPAADGTVEGITSLSSSMTLFTNTEGAIIECEYNRDASTVIKNIEAMLKGNVKTAKIGEVTLLASAWVGADNLYSQVVNVAGATANSQVDLTPSVQQLAIFYNKDISFVTENEGGVVTVYVIGQKPTNDYTMQVTITEVEV